MIAVTVPPTTDAGEASRLVASLDEAAASRDHAHLRRVALACNEVKACPGCAGRMRQHERACPVRAALQRCERAAPQDLGRLFAALAADVTSPGPAPVVGAPGGEEDGESLEAFARRVRREHKRWLQSPEQLERGRELDEHRRQWELRHGPALPESEPELTGVAKDRADFLAALDQNAPHVLRSLKWLPIGARAEWRIEDEWRLDEYVRGWVQQYPRLRDLPWFLWLARNQARSPDRDRWNVPDPHSVTFSTLIPGPGSEIHPWQPYVDREPRDEAEAAARHEALSSFLQWDPFLESEEDYQARVASWVGRYVRRVKRWKEREGYPDAPAARERRIPLERRWDLLVRRVVLGHTYDQLREFLDVDDDDLTDRALRDCVRASAARIGLSLSGDPDRS